MNINIEEEKLNSGEFVNPNLSASFSNNAAEVAALQMELADSS